MTRPTTTVAIFALAGLLTTPVLARQSKTPLPAAIATAFHAAYPAAEIKNVSKEKESGKEVYEVESVDKGRRRDLVYNPDGTVVSLEEELTQAELPASVVTAIKARYPKATMTTIEKLIEGKTQQYEIQLKGAPVGEVVLTLDGRWVSPKIK